MASHVCNNGTQNYKIEHYTLECEGCDIYSSWAVWKDHGSFLTQNEEDFCGISSFEVNAQALSFASKISPKSKITNTMKIM